MASFDKSVRKQAGERVYIVKKGPLCRCEQRKKKRTLPEKQAQTWREFEESLTLDSTTCECLIGTEGKKFYNCDICCKHFSKIPHLMNHQRMHTDRNLINLRRECGKGSVCGSSRLRLSQDHPGERLSKGHDHQGIHTGEKPYKCKECGKGFFRPSGLLIYLRHHSGERPYKCDDMGRCFPRMLNLLTFKCNNYGKAFPQSAYVFDHQRLHNGEKSYDCSECGGVFILNKSLVLLSALERVSVHAKTVVKSLAPTETFLTVRDSIMEEAI